MIATVQNGSMPLIELLLFSIFHILCITRLWANQDQRRNVPDAGSPRRDIFHAPLIGNCKPVCHTGIGCMPSGDTTASRQDCVPYAYNGEHIANKQLCIIQSAKDCEMLRSHYQQKRAWKLAR